MAQKKLCIWLNQKGGPCPWQSLPKMDYCKRHSIYQGIFTKEDIPHLKKCSGCKNMFKNEENNSYKMCIKCRQRSVLNHEKIKKENGNENNKCQGKTQKGNPCAYKCLPNDKYCEKHQSYKRWKEATDAGQNICKNWIRGCFTIINPDIKECATCRKNAQNKENQRNQTKRNTAIDYNDTKQDGQNMCIKCNKIINIYEIKNNKCLECFNSYHQHEQNRNLRTTEAVISRKITEYKRTANRRNIQWEVSDEVAKTLFQTKCAYCDNLVGLNGIDRIDSAEPYTEINCVACCKYCNIMKASHSVTDFLDIVEYLLAINHHINMIPKFQKKHLFEFSQNATYNRFIADIQSREIHCEISQEMYTYIISQPCAYCKNTLDGNIGANASTGARGIDRIDSTIGYVPQNITPCCKTCNIMKNILTVPDFFTQLKSIYNFRVLHIINETQSITDKIKLLCNNVRTLQHEKFFHSKDYYDNLTFGFHPDENTLEAVKKIQLKLEFVQDKKQRDIWNYFRRNVSSLKKVDGAKLVGRQMHILAKDGNTNKYLGILSLSSDVYNLYERDHHIGWSIKDKDKYLSNIANITTCVPLQPFGYNFNGGKLLTALAFSQEIANHYRDKYNDSLLGIITTSLYGKSIQYDRLPFIKFIGYTKGHSVKDIPSEVTRLCADYLKKECGHDYPLRKKFIILQMAFDKLGISKEDFLQSNRKGIYFGYTAHNSRDILVGKTPAHMCPQYNEYVKPTAEVFDWWVHRWAIQRFTNLVKKNKVQTSVSVSVSV